MRNKIVALLIITAFMVAGVAWYLHRSPEPIPVVMLVWLGAGGLAGSSDTRAADLFAHEHPDSLIEFMIVDDQWLPEESRKRAEQAIAEGVHFFITAHPSSSAVMVQDLFTDGRALAIVTGSTTPELSGKDDYSIRLIPDVYREQQAIAQYMDAELSGERLLVIQDTGNLPYTDPALQAFKAALSSRWSVTHHPTVVSAFDPEVLRAVMADAFDALYILAGSYQPSIGNMAQLFHHQHPEAPIMLTPWTQSPAIFNAAGPARARLIVPNHYPSRIDSQHIASYYARFEHHFGYLPYAITLTVRQAFELLDQAFTAGQRTPEQVKTYLLSGTATHQTSVGTVRFDAYGDALTDFYFLPVDRH